MGTRRAAFWHGALAAYLWLISWFPLGNWNRQQDETLLVRLLHGHGIPLDDIFALGFVSAPALLFWLTFRYRNFWLASAGLLLDAIWAAMQIQSWWIPYLFGTQQSWQIRYAHGPTTKVLPSFGNHVAPDGMHLMIHVLLSIAMLTGVVALRHLWGDRQTKRKHVSVV